MKNSHKRMRKSKNEQPNGIKGKGYEKRVQKAV